MAFNDDSFIREVNEELRSDQLRFVWRRFGRLIIGRVDYSGAGTLVSERVHPAQCHVAGDLVG